ncbi:hypothetical protein INR49_014534 [Caranx melampygus]|nr:hypothetical protein INR49_014534 [Caranx melampygus]
MSSPRATASDATSNDEQPFKYGGRVLASPPVSPAAALEPCVVEQTPCGAETLTGRHMSQWTPQKGRLGVLSDMGGASVVVWQKDRRGYCFEGVARATEAAVAAVEEQGGWRVGTRRDEHRAGPGAGMALLAPGMADELADGAQRRQVLAPALSPLLLVLDRVPGKEDEDEADELEAGGQAEVDEAERGDIVLPAGAVHAAVLLPQHAGGVNHSTECDNDGGGLGTGGDERDDEEEDEERDEGVAGAVAFPRHGVTVLVQVGFNDDKLELVDLAAGGRSDDLSALDAATKDRDWGRVEEVTPPVARRSVWEHWLLAKHNSGFVCTGSNEASPGFSLGELHSEPCGTAGDKPKQHNTRPRASLLMWCRAAASEIEVAELMLSQPTMKRVEKQSKDTPLQIMASLADSLAPSFSFLMM